MYLNFGVEGLGIVLITMLTSTEVEIPVYYHYGHFKKAHFQSIRYSKGVSVLLKHGHVNFEVSKDVPILIITALLETKYLSVLSKIAGLCLDGATYAHSLTLYCKNYY